MKRQKTLIAALCIMSGALLSSCSSESESTSGESRTAAQFTAVIDGKTRAYDTNWDNGDQIGVSGTSAAVAYSNVAYQTAEGDGSFTAVNASEAIYYQDDAEVTFTAYYPHSSSTTVTADTHEQASQKQFDFLYATGTGSKASPSVALRFAHKMARLVFTVVPGDGVSYDEVKAATLTLAGFKAGGSFDATTGTASASDTDSEAWQFANNTANATYNAKLTLDAENSAAIYSLILFPQELSAAMPFTATNVQTYRASIDLTEANTNAGDTSAKNELVAGRQYNLKVTLSKTGIKVVSCNIEPWNSVDGGNASAE